ncbi:MAG: TraB/GumN family protein [Pseudomonadota bacterium]
MKKYLLAMLAALLPATLHAQCQGTDLRSLYPPAEVAALRASLNELPYAEGIAYEATRGDTRVFLFGTVHLHDVAIPELVHSRLETADMLLVEITPLEQEGISTFLRTPSNIMRNPDEPGLAEVLGEELWPLYRDHTTTVGLPESIAERLQSWFALTLIGLPVCEIRGQAQTPTLDNRIIAAAQTAGVPVSGLETAFDGFAPLRDTPEEDRTELLREAVRDLANAESAIVTAKLLWQEEQTQFLINLDQLENDSNPMMDGVREGLLEDRNRAWLPRILLAADYADDIMVAVGAGHLGGEQGLLVLLEERGFAITRLNPF